LAETVLVLILRALAQCQHHHLVLAQVETVAFDETEHTHKQKIESKYYAPASAPVSAEVLQAIVSHIVDREDVDIGVHVD
jgi:hypothetical protein